MLDPQASADELNDAFEPEVNEPSLTNGYNKPGPRATMYFCVYVAVSSIALDINRARTSRDFSARSLAIFPVHRSMKDEVGFKT